MRVAITYFLLILLVFGPAVSLQADTGPRIQVVALFSDKAMLRINGKQLLMKAGELKEGVRLIRASSREAVIEINGKQKHLGLGSQVSTRLSEPEKKTVRIPSRHGMYLTQGFINGRRVDFLVDTGATLISMSRLTADRLQLPYLESGKVTQVSTAADIRNAWYLKLASVSVGGITLPQVDAVVIDTEHDQEILLGMSFLGRLKFSQQQGLVVLECC